jgi:hypothetical protein
MVTPWWALFIYERQSQNLLLSAEEKFKKHYLLATKTLKRMLEYLSNLLPRLRKVSETLDKKNTGRLTLQNIMDSIINKNNKKEANVQL